MMPLSHYRYRIYEEKKQGSGCKEPEQEVLTSNVRSASSHPPSDVDD